MALEDGEGIAFSAPAWCPVALRSLEKHAKSRRASLQQHCPFAAGRRSLPLKKLCLQ
jgi:hypothetical protein